MTQKGKVLKKEREHFDKEMALDLRIIALLKKLDPETQCEECKGIGFRMIHSLNLWDEPVNDWMLCPACKGTGVKNDEP